MINESKNNGMFITLQGGYSKVKPNKVYTFTKGLFGEKGNMLELNWNERFDQHMVNQISDFKKIVIDTTSDAEERSRYWDVRKKVGKLERKEGATQEDKTKLLELYKELSDVAPERKEFFHNFDAVEYIENNISKFDGKRFRLKGEIKVSYWNEKFYTNYEVTSIESVLNDEIPNKLEGVIEVYFGKDAIDKTYWNKETKLFFDTYIKCYDRGHRKDVLMPYKTVFDGSTFDIEGKHKPYIALLGKIMTAKGKVVNRFPFEIIVS